MLGRVVGFLREERSTGWEKMYHEYFNIVLKTKKLWTVIVMRRKTFWRPRSRRNDGGCLRNNSFLDTVKCGC